MVLEQGYGAGLAVRWPVEIEGQWDSLAATAASLASETRAAAADLESAQSVWGGLVSSYRETETQAVVYSALDDSPRVVREWADVAEGAAEVLQSFATEANGLQQRSVALGVQALRLQARLVVSNLVTGGGGDSGGDGSAEDDALRREIEVHNTEVMTLDSRWRQLESEAAADLDSIAGGGGLQEEIPVIGGAGGGAFAGPGGDLMPAGGLDLAGGLAGGDTGGGAGGSTLLAAVTHMIHQGAHADQEDPVETAQDLYGRASGGDATGQDIQEFREHLAAM